MKKSIHRIVLTAIAMVVGSFALVAVSSAPAQAATATTSYIGYNGNSIKHGFNLTLEAAVRHGNNQAVTSGTVIIQRKIIGVSKPTWVNLYSASLSSSVPQPRWTFKPNHSAYYRVKYVGNATYNPSYAKAVRINVRRNLRDNFKKSNRVFYGKATPKYGKRTIWLQKSTCANPQAAACKWKVYKTIKTKATGAWSVKVPTQRKRTHYRALVKGSNGYAASYSNYYVTTYRY